MLKLCPAFRANFGGERCCGLLCRMIMLNHMVASKIQEFSKRERWLA